VRNATWEVEVDRANSDTWSQLVDTFDDASIYQTAAYGEVHWGKKNLSRLVLKRDGEAVGIAQVRLICPVPLKCGIAYLRWGPLWELRNHPLDPEIPARIASAIEEEYVQRRNLFLRIVPNAFAGSKRADVFRTAFSKFAPESQAPEEVDRTFVLDLEPSLDDLRKGLDKKWRNQLTRSEKNSLTIIAGNSVKEFRAFREMYTQMRKRKAFETTVDIDEFERIQEQLPESQRMRILICQDQGVPVAGLVASVTGNSAIYLLGATSDAGLNAKGAYLLQWTMIGYFKEKGIRFYDLGGIDPEGNPGVYHFKKGLSGVDVSQIQPLVASRSLLSSAMVKVALNMQRTIRASRRPFHRPRASRHPAAVN
jgi:lipid II:glycine glycyltransferase (peptidoglycan interpeptide bridge formation enzyme)